MIDCSTANRRQTVSEGSRRKGLALSAVIDTAAPRTVTRTAAVAPPPPTPPRTRCARGGGEKGAPFFFSLPPRGGGLGEGGGRGR